MKYISIFQKSDEEISFIKLLKMQTQDWPWLLIGLIGATGCGFILPIFVIYYGEIFRVSTLISVSDTNFKRGPALMFVKRKEYAFYCMKETVNK